MGRRDQQTAGAQPSAPAPNQAPAPEQGTQDGANAGVPPQGEGGTPPAPPEPPAGEAPGSEAAGAQPSAPAKTTLTVRLLRTALIDGMAHFRGDELELTPEEALRRVDRLEAELV